VHRELVELVEEVEACLARMEEYTPPLDHQGRGPEACLSNEMQVEGEVEQLLLQANAFVMKLFT
jgi:hypothetical protein